MRFFALLLALCFCGMDSSARAALAIVHPAIERVEDGAPVFLPDGFGSGETVHFSFQVEGLTRKDAKLGVSYEAEPVDPAGVALVSPIQGEYHATLAPEDKDYLPKLRGSFDLPPVLLPGTYSIAIQVHDDVHEASAAREVTFAVEGQTVEPSAVLAIRGLNFYRSEESKRPLVRAAFRTDEEIHVRFAIAGFRLGPKNAIDISYGFEITAADGRIVFGQASAGREQSADFYPKPFIPANLSISLNAGTPPALYTLTVTAQDAVGNQHVEEQRTLQLE